MSVKSKIWRAFHHLNCFAGEDKGLPASCSRSLPSSYLRRQDSGLDKLESLSSSISNALSIVPISSADSFNSTAAFVDSCTWSASSGQSNTLPRMPMLTSVDSLYGRNVHISSDTVSIFSCNSGCLDFGLDLVGIPRMLSPPMSTYSMPAMQESDINVSVNPLTVSEPAIKLSSSTAFGRGEEAIPMSKWSTACSLDVELLQRSYSFANCEERARIPTESSVILSSSIDCFHGSTCMPSNSLPVVHTGRSNTSTAPTTCKLTDEGNTLETTIKAPSCTDVICSEESKTINKTSNIPSDTQSFTTGCVDTRGKFSTCVTSPTVETSTCTLSNTVEKVITTSTAEETSIEPSTTPSCVDTEGSFSPLDTSTTVETATYTPGSSNTIEQVIRPPTTEQTSIEPSITEEVSVQPSPTDGLSDNPSSPDDIPPMPTAICGVATDEISATPSAIAESFLCYLDSDETSANVSYVDELPVNPSASDETSTNTSTGNKTSISTPTTIKTSENPPASDEISANPLASDKISANPLASDKISANPLAIIVETFAKIDLSTSDETSESPPASDGVSASPSASDGVSASSSASDKISANHPPSSKTSANPSVGDGTSANPSVGDGTSTNSSAWDNTSVKPSVLDEASVNTSNSDRIVLRGSLEGETSLAVERLECRYLECDITAYQEVIANHRCIGNNAAPSTLRSDLDNDRNSTLTTNKLQGEKFLLFGEVVNSAKAGSPGKWNKGLSCLVMPAQFKEKKNDKDNPQDMRFPLETAMEPTSPPAQPQEDVSMNGERRGSCEVSPLAVARSHIAPTRGKHSIVDSQPAEHEHHINNISTDRRVEVIHGSSLVRSASVSPRNSSRVRKRPGLLLSSTAATNKEEDDSPNSLDFDSKAYLMSIRGGKVKTSPRQGSNSLSLPNSPHVQRGAVSPPRIIPPRLKTHRRTVSALANVHITTPAQASTKREHGDAPEPPFQKSTPKVHPKALLRRLKSLSGGLVAAEEDANTMSLPIKLYKSDPRAVAEELTVLDGEMLRRIKPQELRNGAWMKKEKEQSAPNIMQLIQSFNRLALLTSTEVLAEETPQARAKVISAFIQIADKLYQLQNFNSLKAVLSGLQCTPIYRLQKTWSSVSSKKRKMFDNLCDIMSPDNNWKVYRNMLSLALRKPPCIPFLGQLLTDVVQNEAKQKAIMSKASPIPSKKSRTSLTLASTPNTDEGCSPLRGSSEQLKDITSESPLPKRRLPKLQIVSPSLRRRRSLPGSEGNSLVNTPSPSSSSSHWSFDKSDSGVSSHASYSCPDLLSIPGGSPLNISRLSSRRKSSSTKIIFGGTSFVPVYTQYIGGSQSFEDLAQGKLGSSKEREDCTGSDVALALEQFGRVQLNGVQAKYVEFEGETDTATTSSRMDSSFSSLEELLSADEVELDEDRVFASREHTPGSSVDLTLGTTQEEVTSRKTRTEADLDISDITVSFKEDEEEGCPSETGKTSPSDSPFKGRSSRFSSFREKARTSLRGWKRSQRRKGKHSQEVSPFVFASHLDLAEVLEALQVASLGYCGNCGPYVAIRRFLLVAQVKTEDQCYHRSKELEPQDQLS